MRARATFGLSTDLISFRVHTRGGFELYAAERELAADQLTVSSAQDKQPHETHGIETTHVVVIVTNDSSTM